ncbi:MAG: MMPL family transporter, partial [Bacteroidota bacterium]
MSNLGTLIHRHRWGILVFWLAIILIASFGARRVESVLLGGSGSIPGSASSRVDATLYRGFDNPFTKAVLVTFQSEKHLVDSEPFREIVEKTAHRMKETKYVRQVMTSYDAPDQKMKSPDGNATAMLVGLEAQDVKEEERRLPTIRQALAPLKEEGLKAGVTIASTGRSALMVDLNAFNAQDSAKAEGR